MRECDEKGGDVAAHHRGHRRPVPPVARTQPAKAADRQRPTETADERQDVPAHGIGRGRHRRVHADEEEREAEPHRSHEAEVLAADRLLEQPRTQHQQVQRRGALQVDGIRGGGEPVGQDEQREARGIGESHEDRAQAPAASSGRRDQHDRERRDAAPEACRLPAGEIGGLDRRAAGREKHGGDRELQPGARTGGHGAKITAARCWGYRRSPLFRGFQSVLAVRQRASDAAPGVMGMLGQFLDRNRDGSVLADLGGMLGKLER